jgi:Plasmid recombination enzyme
MAFGLIRARNLSAADIGSTDEHNARRYKKIEDYPKNVLFIPEVNNEIGRDNNTYRFKSDLPESKTTLLDEINTRIQENDVKGIKSNSNLAIEYVVGINDKKAWDHYCFSGFVSNTKQWLEERHGEGSVVAVYSHLDESNPHAHIIVVPIESKTIKWKNTNGSGERTENRLNTRDYTGGKEKLRDLQNAYFEHLTNRYNGGKKLGLELFRGTLVENQTKQYVEQTNHEIGELRTVLASLDDDIAKNIVLGQILEKQRILALKELELKKEEDRRSGEKKNLWKLKGTKDNPELFHGKTSAEEKNGEKKNKGYRPRN